MNETITAAGLVCVGAPENEAALRASAVESVRVDLAGTAVDVRFNDSEAARSYRSRYRHMLSAAIPQRVAYAVVAAPRVAFFWLEGGAIYRWDQSGVTSHVLAFLADAVVGTEIFTSSEDIVALHAATVGNGVGVAALVGSSTAGKTTTAIACARRQLSLYSDEYCVVAPGGVLPFPRSLSIRCAATEVLANEPVPSSSVDTWLRTHGCCDGYDLGYDELFGSVARPKQLPLRIAFAIVGRSDKAEARRIAPRAMLEYVGPWAKLSSQGLARLQRLLVLLQDV